MHRYQQLIIPRAPRWLQAAAGLFCALGAVLGSPVQAASSTLSVGMDQVLWSYSGDVFQCKLELPIENFGTISFVHDAGHEIQFRVTTQLSAGQKPQVSLESTPWRKAPTQPAMALKTRSGHLALNAEDSRRLLAALKQGLWFKIQLAHLTLMVPTVRWEERDEDFHRCETRLSPLSITQARDRTLFYKLGQRALTTEQLQELAKVARYIKLDKQVSKVLIDSYTDNTGSYLANLQLSRERAADVAAALRELGVPASLIEQRAHGERYPSANNSTSEGRDLNRRVTLRIIRTKNGNTR